MSMLKRIWWKILFFVLFICNGFTANALNVDAGEDRKVCKNGFAVLGDSPTVTGGQAPYTFSWRTGTGVNISNESNPTVFPTQTTTYTVTVVDANGISCIDFITLTIVEIKLSVEADLTECMEERELTFSATVLGLDLADGPITFRFWHQTQHLVEDLDNYHYKTMDIVSSDSYTVLHTVKANPSVASALLQLKNHFYTATDYVNIMQGDLSCFGEPVIFDVHELAIEYIADHTSGKDWKVVVGKNIDYRAHSSNDCNNWSWKMPDGVNGIPVDYECGDLIDDAAWNPTGGSARSNTNLTGLAIDNGTPIVIPFDDFTDGTGNLRAQNSWFGPTYGLTEVSCFDSEGDCYHDSKTVKVFFDPDLDLAGQATKNNPWLIITDPITGKPVPIPNGVTNTNEPCWYIFWKNGNVVDGIGNFVYDPHKAWGVGGYANNNGRYLTPFSDEGFTEVIHIFDDVAQQHLDIIITGKHTDFLDHVISHENHHFYIRTTPAWVNHPKQTDSDRLPDPDEINPGTLSPLSRTYFPHSESDNPNTFGLSATSGYTSYADNEIRCRLIGEAEPSNVTSEDWSMDPENTNWK